MSRHRRPSGSVLGADLPYVAIGAVSLLLLVGYLAGAGPFGRGEVAPPSSTASTVFDDTAPAVTSPASSASSAIVGSAIDSLERGEDVFNGTCIACHGAGGIGIDGLGKPLPTSAFVAGLSDEALLAFLLVGRPVEDPSNTTGVACPARGGNTSLTDADLAAVVAYLRSIAAPG